MNQLLSWGIDPHTVSWGQTPTGASPKRYEASAADDHYFKGVDLSDWVGYRPLEAAKRQRDEMRLWREILAEHSFR